MLLGAFAHAQQQAPVYDLRVGRDAGCGCCHAWAEAMRRSGRFRVTLTDEPDIAALKRRLGVPSDLTSCHTGVVDGYVIEGHVPVEDVLRLLRERPANVRGLAVAGMPRGSPGMETPDGARDRFAVFAFERNGARRVFANHG
jgi:hypothetical protein